MKNEFDKETKYKLFRSVQEILHPTISKKNISDYKIIVEESILPIRVFYPQKISHLSKVMIFIRGNGKVTDCYEKYSDICKLLTNKTDSLTIAVEYEEGQNMYQDVYNTVKYLYERLEKDDINPENIILIGDSTGANIIAGIHYLNHKEIKIGKEILFYPVLSSDYSNREKYESYKANFHFNIHLLDNLEEYFKSCIDPDHIHDPLFNPLENSLEEIPKTLLFVGKVDSLKDEAEVYFTRYKDYVQYVELPFVGHGFLKKMDEELVEEVFDKIKEFIA